MADEEIYDLFVIGGGINGAGVARDAAGRGLKVALSEKADLAEGTSSRSGKLVHGGLRYLEYYEFRLVREALIEREVLLNAAPHIIWPMRFVLPHSPQDRPAWLVRLGLFLYDHLGGRKRLPGTRSLDLRRDPEGIAIVDSYTRGFEYSDCWVDDARLVVLNAVDAAARGAVVLTRSPVVSARRENGLWSVTTRSSVTGEERRFRARCLVNCAGPWVSDVIGRVAGSNSARNVRLVKGSHIIVPKFWTGANAYLVQNHDKRVIFINPYEGDKALIGTTDIAYEGRAEDVAADEAEIEYLLKAVNRYFKEKLRREDVLHSFSGVRPLFDDGKGNPSAVTRDYVFDLDETAGVPMLNVFGGKLTTYRRLAEHALEKIGETIGEKGASWTAGSRLPGGDFAVTAYEPTVAKLLKAYPFLQSAHAERLVRCYGTDAQTILGAARTTEDLGRYFGGTLYEAEVRWLIEREWAVTAEDVLWRRTKQGLFLTPEEAEGLEGYMGLMAAA